MWQCDKTRAENEALQGVNDLYGKLQIVVDGIDVMSLPVGTQIQLGDSAIIELTMVRTSCAWLELIHGQSKESANGLIGMLAKVVEGGEIRVGDTIHVLAPVEKTV